MLIYEISRIFLKLDDLQEDTRAKIEEISTSKAPFLRNHITFSEFEDYHKIETIRLHFKSDQINARLQAISDLKSIFSDCTSLEEQLDIFSIKTPNLIKLSIKDLKPAGEIQILLAYAGLLDHMIFQTEFLVKLDDCIFEQDFDYSSKDNLSKVFVMYFDNPQSLFIEKKLDEKSSRIIKFVSKEHQRALQSRSEGIYSIVAFLVNTFLNYPKVYKLQLTSLKSLWRLYFQFPKYRISIQKVLTSLFQIFAEVVGEDV